MAVVKKAEKIMLHMAIMVILILIIFTGIKILMVIIVATIIAVMAILMMKIKLNLLIAFVQNRPNNCDCIS